jgi:hypothetical protein
MGFLKTLTFLTLAMGLIFALSALAQQKPLTQGQVQSLVGSGLGDETGAKAIEQRGIDFAPAEDFLQSLKAAGASEAFLKALSQSVGAWALHRMAPPLRRIGPGCAELSKAHPFYASVTAQPTIPAPTCSEWPAIRFAAS